MRKARMIARTAGMIGALLLSGLAVSPAANAAPKQLAKTGLLAPTIKFTFGGEGTLGQFGASVGINASYKCSAIDSPVLPQFLGSSSFLTLQITENIGHNGTETITQASRTLTNLVCDGRTHSGPVYAATDAGMLPLLSGGDAVAVMTMKVCDLFGCTAAGSVGVVAL
ncbi:MAG: hypothetical protein QOF20_1386 [Acidimicrobiaceae bacterium]|jgi:hypothetical protein|nr:hypothetical protein [Acidimicrobiaceae bacterium]MDQ1369033.1 hypothetical protein [Acidimicrobiaceae bacterium]MDQ1400799.1 hypothetical protein [Acidimicrobiaceae bacterium]